MSKLRIFDVADYFLSRVELAAGSLMTHLKLQKLCYYAQAWHLVFADNTMFDESFQAWAHGPVCPELWLKYREYSWNPLPLPESFDSGLISESVLDTLQEVWDAYGQFDAKYLERLTHQEDPWIKARGQCQPGEACDAPISLESMKEYYSKLQVDG